MEYSAEMIYELVPYLLPIGISLVVISVIFGIIRRIRRKIESRRPQHQREIQFVSSIVSWVILVIILMTLLESMNVPLGNVWTAVSTVLAMVAIGFFAVWSVLSHMTAAVILFFQRPFQPGQYLQLGDESYFGRVINTSLFFTTVEDTEGGRSRIPNNMLFQKRYRITHEAPTLMESD